MKYILIILPVILLGLMLILTRETILLAIGDFLIVQDELHLADAIHVIGGPDNTRIDYAIQLWRQGYAQRIILTGGWCDCLHANSAEYARQRALQQGVPADAIIVDGTQVTSTFAEIILVKEAISHGSAPIHSLISVSDPFHMWRSRWAYREILGDQFSVQMAPVPFEQGPYQYHWWTDAASRKYVKDEYLKIIYYYARYRFGVGPVGRWLAALDTE